MTMRFRTRAFLMCFITFALLMTSSFWMIQRFAQSMVGDGLRTSLRENQLAIARLHEKSDQQNNRFLKVAGENASLKAGIELLRSQPRSESARRTVEDQLREMGEHMGFDFLLVSAPDGAPLAGVIRREADGRSQLAPVETSLLDRRNQGLLILQGRTFQVASVPVDRSEENIGSLSVGEYFDFSKFTTPAVLIHGGKVVESNISSLSFAEADGALSGCNGEISCNVKLHGGNWISLPMEALGGGDQVRSLQNVDEAATPVQSRLRQLFLTVALFSVLVALISSVASSRSIVRPIGALVSHLRNAVRTGVLTEFQGQPSSILEIRELAESYNRAALSARASGEVLQGAYLEFAGSLANALDARDRYTSGHSQRVSQFACATAEALGLDWAQIEQIRVGALLHDIGKIGVADSVLQKTGLLTTEEFAMIKQHPVIGRRILEGVQGLASFIPAVELHHENWDGSGYPKGQSGEETPVDARIIHVADAYDAMTTDRSYRRGMTHERAIEILIEFAGTQFDPNLVEIFRNLPREILIDPSASDLFASVGDEINMREAMAAG
jgi:putative nucleotidyltransferase with HDIG domain